MSKEFWENKEPYFIFVRILNEEQEKTCYTLVCLRSVVISVTCRDRHTMAPLGIKPSFGNGKKNNAIFYDKLEICSFTCVSYKLFIFTRNKKCKKPQMYT